VEHDILTAATGVDADAAIIEGYATLDLRVDGIAIYLVCLH